MRKKWVQTAAFITVLLMSAIAATQLVNFGRANPYFHDSILEGETSPPEGTIPPTVSILSPKNNTVYGSSSFSLIFNISIASAYGAFPDISRIYYRPSWLSSSISISPKAANNYSVNVKDVPEGTHSLAIFAVQDGRIFTREVIDQHKVTIYHYYSTFKITGSSRIKFTIDVTPPKVSILSIQNRTYNMPNVPLDIAVNDSISKLSYVLDSQDNVTISGNATLTGLSAGEHNVTVYATDLTGHFGGSETIYFSVEVPFPTTIAIASVITIAVVGIGSLVYFKKRRKLQEINHAS